jgi:hypothetical protein
MLSFQQFITEEKNLHLVHAEDAIIDGGVIGTRRVIDYIRAIRDMFAGNATRKVNVNTKFDGCVHEDTVICTNLGDLTIKEVIEKYENGIAIKVMGRTLEDPIPVDKFIEIIGASISTGTKDWVEIHLENGTVLKMTEDHEVFTTNRGWVQAKDLTKDDDIHEI